MNSHQEIKSDEFVEQCTTNDGLATLTKSPEYCASSGASRPAHDEGMTGHRTARTGEQREGGQREQAKQGIVLAPFMATRNE